MIPSFLASRLIQSSEIFGDDPVLFGQPVDTIVRLPHAADGATDGVRLVSAGHSARLRIHIGDVNLDGSVVLCRNDAVRRRALPRDIHIHVFSGFVLHDEKLECETRLIWLYGEESK